MRDESRHEGLALSNRIERSRGEKSGIAIWYLGQSGFLLQHGGTSIAIDPFLSGETGVPSSDDLWKRNYPPPIAAEELAGVDLILCTHDHGDHTDPETLRGIAAASPGCRIAGPRASIRHLEREGFAENRRTILREGTLFPFRGVVIEPVSVAHEEHENDVGGFDLFLGYLIHWEGLTFFHAGDTVVTPRLSARLSGIHVDVAFLPINGRSEERHKLEIVGNMNAAEAVRFATDQKFGLVVPVHYDLYACNGASVADFVAVLERIPIAQRPRFKAFRPGERMVYTRRDSSRR
jgi:L-ascorbate 6-phosphate lactonase